MSIPMKKVQKKSKSDHSVFRKQENNKNSLNKQNSPAQDILNLHHTLGNRAVQRLFESGAIQAKLKIGQPNDIYEQEADRVADAVMRMSEPSLQRQAEPEKEKELLQPKAIGESITPLVQRQSEEEEEELQAKGDATAQNAAAIEPQLRAQQGGGQTLPSKSREFFEPRFETDFSQVRVHNDTASHDMARTISAQAFTLGKHIYFGAGRYDTQKPSGRHLMAHELTHTVQQSKGGRRLQRIPLVRIANQLIPYLFQPHAKPTLGVDITQWHNKIDSELKTTGNKYAIAVVGGIALTSLPSKYDDGVQTFLSELQGELAKYALSLIPYAGGALSALAGSAASARDKIEASSVKSAFASFKKSLQTHMLGMVEKLVRSKSAFNDQAQNNIIAKAKTKSDFTTKPETEQEKVAYAEKMERFIEEEVNLALFQNATGDYKSILAKVNDYIQRKWTYFILVRASALATYRRCRWSLMRPGSKCDKGYWSWTRYDKSCLHKACKANLSYYPMPDDWQGPRRQLNMGMCGSQSCTWYTVSTNVEQPGGLYSVRETAYEREKNRYKE